MFTVFLIIAAWNIPSLPLWLQVCITIFGILALVIHVAKGTVNIVENRDR